jgi:hypothetical protein
MNGVRGTRRRSLVKGLEVDPVAIVAVVGEAVATVAVAGVTVAAAMEQDLMAGVGIATGVLSQTTGHGNARASSLLRRRSKPLRPKKKRQVFSSPRWMPPCCQIQLSLAMAAVIRAAAPTLIPAMFQAFYRGVGIFWHWCAVTVAAIPAA